MANMLIPFEERNLTPDEVEHLDRRRRRGQLLLVMGYQFTLVGLIVSLFAGQDFQYSPGWMHPMGYWEIFLVCAAITCFVRGIALRRGANEFLSY